MHKLLIPFFLALLLLVLLWWPGLREHDEAGAVDAQGIARELQKLWQSPTASKAALPAAEAVYLAARRRGWRLAHTWQDGEQALPKAIQAVQQQLAQAGDIASVDTLELVFAQDFERLDPGRRNWSTNIHRGVYGFEMTYGGVTERHSPTYMLATNRSTRRLLELFKQRHGISDTQSRHAVIYRQFKAQQWLVRLGQQPQAQAMQRGNVYVPLSQVSRESAGQLARLATDWMSNNLQANGRMTYKYWPSARVESQSNNMIRQWMATIALIRAARHWGDEGLMQRAADNIEYNLGQFYREENGFGLIEWQGKIKLGAVALAALALVEHAESQRWAQQEAALRRTTDHLWHEDGSFTTFYKPAGRNDIQNFYPGEALLYWASLYERDGESSRLERIMKSYVYYRDWHLQPANRNPAFIPWHTQAYYKVWQLTGNKELQEFVFTMNDWLVAEMLQEAEDVLYPDTAGRFYNPRRRYGPPHVSSTGVYLEGLIDAFSLAQQSGEAQRRERYRQAINLGLRSVMQLQFVDEVDMYYVPVSLRGRVKGGLRTTVYNNEIRCDNVQHNLMGVIKILQAFSVSDYRHNR